MRKLSSPFFLLSLLSILLSSPLLASNPCDGNPRTVGGASLTCIIIDLPSLDPAAAQLDPARLLRVNIKSPDSDTTAVVVEIGIVHSDGSLVRATRVIVSTPPFPSNTTFSFPLQSGDTIQFIQMSGKADKYNYGFIQ